MIVLTLSKCPDGLKGDISKWLFEIGSGVYVGRLSARVRERLWARVCELSGSGEATMVFTAKNEQGFSFYVNNSEWKPVDFDGLVFLRKPLPEKKKSESCGISQKRSLSKGKKHSAKDIDISQDIINGICMPPDTFVAVDIETTGLRSKEDVILEVGAVRFVQGKAINEFHSLVNTDGPIPEEIQRLTGIDKEVSVSEGKPIKEVIHRFDEFVQDDVIIGHYIKFDMGFIHHAEACTGGSTRPHRVIDTIALAKSSDKVSGESYKLETLVTELHIADKQYHRALPDAYLAAQLYLKLNENEYGI